MVEGLIVPRPERAAALYREHGPAVLAFLRSRVLDAAAVEDLCHETFVAALARGVPAEGAGPWLCAIARNKALRYLRDRKPVPPTEPERAARDADPAARLDAAEQRALVRAAVAGLGVELAEVILLRYEGGLDYKQIATHLGVPVSTVQGRLKRARVALKKVLLPPRAP